jgi:hypothetical protein
MLALQQPITRLLGLVVPALDFFSMRASGFQTSHTAEKVVQWLPDLPIELVQRLHHQPIFKPLIAQELPHSLPVLLLHIPVVVPVVRRRSIKPDLPGSLPKILHKRAVQKLVSFVAITRRSSNSHAASISCVAAMIPSAPGF